MYKLHFIFRMPLTNAERQRRFREKHKEDCRKKEAERKRQKRKHDQVALRKREKKTKPACRAKLASSDASQDEIRSSSPAYKSASSMAKAVKRARCSLPGSPLKRAAVVRCIAEELSIYATDESSHSLKTT